MGRLAPGTAVKVHADSRALPYDGIVAFVSPASEFTPKNVETPDLRTALVDRLRIVISNPDAALRQGMPVTVRQRRRPGARINATSASPPAAGARAADSCSHPDTR